MYMPLYHCSWLFVWVFMYVKDLNYICIMFPTHTLLSCKDTKLHNKRVYRRMYVLQHAISSIELARDMSKPYVMLSFEQLNIGLKIMSHGILKLTLFERHWKEKYALKCKKYENDNKCGLFISICCHHWL